MKFLIDIIKGIKAACGNDFPIVVRLSVDECYSMIGKPEIGYKLEDGVRMAKVLEKKGLMPLMSPVPVMIHIIIGWSLPLLSPAGENIWPRQ